VIFLVEVLSRMVLFGFFIFLYLWIERGQTIKRLRGIVTRLQDDNVEILSANLELMKLIKGTPLANIYKDAQKKGTGRKPTGRKRK
jgi:hypothetical protein